MDNVNLETSTTTTTTANTSQIPPPPENGPAPSSEPSAPSAKEALQQRLIGAFTVASALSIFCKYFFFFLYHK